MGQAVNNHRVVKRRKVLRKHAVTILFYPKNIESSLVSDLTEGRKTFTEGGMSITKTEDGSTVKLIFREYDSDHQEDVESNVAKVNETNIEMSASYATIKEMAMEKSSVCEESMKNILALQQKQKLMTDEKRTDTNEDKSAEEEKSYEVLNDKYRTKLKPEIEGVKELDNTTACQGSAEIGHVFCLNEGKENESPNKTFGSMGMGIAVFDEKAVVKEPSKCEESSVLEAKTVAEGSSSSPSAVNMYPGTPLPAVCTTNPEVINNQSKLQMIKTVLPHLSSSEPPTSPARVSFTMKAQGILIPKGKTKLLFNLSMKPNVPLIKGMLAFKEEIQADVEKLRFVCEGRALTGAELVNEVKGKTVLVSKKEEEFC